MPAKMVVIILDPMFHIYYIILNHTINDQVYKAFP